MRRLANVLTGFVALEHLWFLIFEMFLWRSPLALKQFGTSPAVAETTAVLAANQGVYNGILAAGLIWGLMTPGSEGKRIKTFFLSAVIVAGVYGGLSALPFILFAQALPAALALIAVRRSPGSSCKTPT